MAGDPLKKGRYTNFGNKIGLFSNKTGNFICNSPEVVLNFPFKDTVLEAGMTKEDTKADIEFMEKIKAQGYQEVKNIGLVFFNSDSEENLFKFVNDFESKLL